MSEVLGVILAGGRGKRLGGQIKANLEIGEQRLIERVANTLGGQCKRIVVSTGHLPLESLQLPETLQAVADLGNADAGPVAGLASIVAWAAENHPNADYLLSVAVDTPFFPSDFIARALPKLVPGIDCVMGIEAEQPYPTNALWRLSALSQLPEMAKNDSLPRGLWRVLNAENVGYVRYEPHDPAGCFFNINTPEDADIAEEMARAN